MTDTKFTPGPWAAFTDDESDGGQHTNIVAFKERTKVVFSLPGYHKNDPDVRLAVTAPDMYEVLNGFVRNRQHIKADDPMDGPLSRLMDMADAALAAAHGEQS